ncbi:unnamed protein product [Rhizophagus irregularis]|uniref:Serine-threonine/tyrosine-protein kinase catalytic domain-containing protein n=1 Tax=Rhizophagus irregularis TaxID=588596 RepID=A0A915YVE3_9GLOM|nr:unnamed protein product [Rhizophagus irregularis]
MNNTTKKIVRELKRQRDVNVHHNVIRFYGITKLNSENEIDQSNNYFDLNSCLREKIIPNTSIDYEKLYTECWDDEPDNRPSMNEVVKRLRTIIYQQNESIDNITYQISNENSTSLNELNEESLINHTSTNSNVDEDLCEIVNDILMKICEITNEGKEQPYLFLDYLNNFDINVEEILI